VLGAVDIGGTKIAVGLVSDQGAVAARLDCETDPGRGYPDALQRITEMLRQCTKTAGVPIEGIGIGCTGPVDPFSGVIGNVDFLPGWEGANIVADLSAAFGVQVAMENDADAAALAEHQWGAGKGKQRFIYVTFGTGVGGGMIFSGRLYRGVDQVHPEIGHHVIDPSGPRCFCGARGCWEVLTRGPALSRWVEEQVPHDWPGFPGLTAQRVCELAREGNELAIRGVQRHAYYLGIGIANLITLFAPDAIVLGGRVMESADLFWKGMWKVVRGSCGLVPPDRTLIAVASLGADTPLIGAAQVWHQRFRPA
jgi:glucokinase